MINIISKEKCCGCNACGDVCSVNAISYDVDIEGFWYPTVDETKCVDCGQCNKVCPVENIHVLKNNDFERPRCIAANHKNLNIRFDSTSGGAFTAFAEPFINNGGYVGGAIYTDEWSVKQIVTNNKEDLVKLRSSKYIQSDATGYYSSIKKLLDNGEKVMAVGLPCQIAALKAFLRRDYSNLLTIDLICRYINSPKVYQKYLSYLEKEYNSKVTYIKPKNKEIGWKKLTHKVVFENGSTYYGTIAIDKFMRASMKSNCLSRPTCYDCVFKGFPRIADISIGDFWSTDKSSELDDDTGTSIILLNSDKGVEYFEKNHKKLTIEPVDIDVVVKGNPALIQPLPRETIDRKQFYERMDEEEFDVVVDSMCPEILTTKMMLKNIAKVVYFEMLFSRFHLIPLVQFIYYNFFHKAIQSNLRKGYVIYTTPHCILEISRKASIQLNGNLVIGNSLYKRSKLETRLYLEEGAKLIIGDDSGRGYGFGYGSDIEIFKDAELISKGGPGTNMNTTIICKNKIVIGREVAIGRNVTIRDNNGGHKININGYIDNLPVFIGEHVWLCQGSTIMSGVKIGDGTIIGAESLINRSFPPHVVVSGNPAKITLENIEWKM